MVFADLPELETGRLMRLDDAQAMFAYASNPEVTRYILRKTFPQHLGPLVPTAEPVDGRRWNPKTSLEG
jgi:hypothetical protein